MNEVIGYVDARAAEVATTAIASDVAQVHQDKLDADADAQAAAASAAAAAGTLANAVKKTGEASQSIAGDIAVAGNLSGGSVTVPAPVNNTDAANKKYVDDQDALLVPIADINSYAVGLTGNQGPITGLKKFTTEINGNLQKISYCGSGGSDVNKWFKVCEMPSDMLRFHGMISSNSGFIFFTGTNASVATKSFGISATMKLIKNNDGSFTLWNKMLNTYTTYYSANINAFRYSGQRFIDAETDGLAYDTPTAGQAEYDNTVIS